MAPSTTHPPTHHRKIQCGEDVEKEEEVRGRICKVVVSGVELRVRFDGTCGGVGAQVEVKLVLDAEVGVRTWVVARESEGDKNERAWTSKA